MSKKTIVAIVLMIGFMSMLLINFGQQVGGYMSFNEAEANSSSANVVGTWVVEEKYQYDKDTNLFSFQMRDEEGGVRKVVYNDPMPANFTDAEKVVVQGSISNDVFVAEHILIKCPSKYNQDLELQEPPTDA